MEWKSRIGLLAALLLVVGSAVGQVDSNRYIVYFSDKENTPYTIDAPFEYLSERAIERRLNQGIEIDERDLPVDPAYIQMVRDLGDVEILYPLKWFNAILIETVDPDVLQGIQDLEEVERVELSTSVSGSQEPELQPLRHSSSKSGEEYGPSLNQIEMLNGLDLHEDGFTGEGIWIGVMDGGYSNMPNAAAFDDFFASDRLIGKRNFVDQNETVFVRSNHGTYVMSTMAGYQEDSLIGTAPEASYLLCITEDVTKERRIEEAFWTAAAEYADSIGVDVLNTSLGYTTFDVVTENYTYADLDGNTALITRASDVAASRGMLVVSSAGNSGNNDWYYIGTPADGDSVLAIGAVNPHSIVTAFSSRGPSFDGRVKPNVMAQGGQSVVTDLGNGIQTANGTSFASPILAGMAACLWQANPQATAWEVHQAIEQSAHLYNMPNDSMGYGIPDFQIARTLLGEVLSTSAADGIDKLNVFPNTIDRGQFSIQVPTKKEFSVTISDLSGRIVHRERYAAGQNVVTVALASNIKKGLYVVSMLDQNQNLLGVTKVIVQ